MELRKEQPITSELEIRRVQGTVVSRVSDQLAVEEPLEIRLEYGAATARVKKSISITMRTPGSDFELAVGFLFTEGIVREASEVEEVGFCGPSGNVVRVALRTDVEVDLKRLERHFYTSSSCGVCGKSSIEALRVQNRQVATGREMSVPSSLIHELPQILRRSQGVFDATGGLHASALFDRRGQLLGVREDVGRHNALDKLIGRAFLDARLPLDQEILLVSGRASFELVQKAAVAGISVFAAVGAPSSLAVELARETDMTLLGFVRENRFNIYTGPARVTS